ncbi:hypothetical protein TREMEDRAFT_64406 [Tremella mesenterica DSM 1558]|uniref:uncharacterized protein n=1 Tax=Tremella mesenterica (strain ATCC 24925 / CBS 8224 / DSM 1558 / NBRC 9311 / NRRL Y-6157 / RJB 2259-6 / UBC 559-6) TaxID=578456 RepID=UPI0003F49BF7|nr:uncharacterized protein TREMEDRAFT_64406 [Tremella mesenterica DSM 1558]EIW67166.1 hypothetical protein TREMEDRAFT_64406 [Tremella mesenterica DSM 1558]
MDPSISKPKQIRKTQRAPKRCETCSKRRIKCDGQIPCSFCLSRSMGHLCKRETVFVKGRLVPGGEGLAPDADLARMSKEDLWAQICSLTREVESLKRRGSSESQSGSAVSPQSADQRGGHDYPRGDSSETREDLDHEYKVFPPEGQNDLGRMAQRLGFIHSDSKVTDEMLEADSIDASMAYPNDLPLPTFELSRQLLDFALDELGWLIAIVPMTFKNEHELAWQYQTAQSGPSESLDVANLFLHRPAWTAMYLALVSCALVYVRQDRAYEWGVPPRQKMYLARLWFRAGVNMMLSGAASLARPNLMHLQTFCVLTLLTQPFNASALHDTLLASMLQAGKRLCVHRQDAPHSAASEIGKRVWGFMLCREAMYAGEEYVPTFCTKAPQPFATYLNIHEPEDDPESEQPMTAPTRVAYLTAQCRLAAYVSDLKCLPPDPSYEKIMEFDQRLSALFEDMPYFEPGYKFQPYHPRWLQTARHVLAMSRQQKRLFLHRHYFALSASHERYARSRSISVEAALRLYDERQANDFPFDDFLDTINHSLPAAIVLLLDAIYPLPSQHTTPQLMIERCEQVERLLGPLRAATYRASTTAITKSLASVDELLQEKLRQAQAAIAAEASREYASTLSDMRHTQIPQPLINGMEGTDVGQRLEIGMRTLGMPGPGDVGPGIGVRAVNPFGNVDPEAGKLLLQRDTSLSALLNDLDFDWMLCNNDASWGVGVDNMWTWTPPRV